MESYVYFCVCFRSLSLMTTAEASGNGGVVVGGGAEWRRFGSTLANGWRVTGADQRRFMDAFPANIRLWWCAFALAFFSCSAIRIFAILVSIAM